MSTCCLPTPACVCESLWLPGPPGGASSSARTVSQFWPGPAPPAPPRPLLLCTCSLWERSAPAHACWPVGPNRVPAGRSGAWVLTWRLTGAAVWGRHLGSVLTSPFWPPHCTGPPSAQRGLEARTQMPDRGEASRAQGSSPHPQVFPARRAVLTPISISRPAICPCKVLLACLLVRIQEPPGPPCAGGESWELGDPGTSHLALVPD